MANKHMYTQTEQHHLITFFSAPTLSSFFFLTILFIYLFWAVLGLRCCAGFSLVAASGGYSSCGAQASHSSGFWFQGTSAAAAHELSSYGSQPLEHRLNGYGAWAELLPTKWDLPGLGIKPVSPALAGGFFTTGPPRKLLHSPLDLAEHCFLFLELCLATTNPTHILLHANACSAFRAQFRFQPPAFPISTYMLL